jgi:poly-beta-1,6-N-acetyl-D-glucosamine N-deacetylase
MFWTASLHLLKSSKLFVFLVVMIIGIAPYCVASDQFICIVYHDITKRVVEKDDVSVDDFIKHLDYFKAGGYQAVSIKDLQDAARGKKTLPEKAILLTFDDAYVSFYDYVYPALKLYNYSAVLSVVTSWMEGKNPGIYKTKKFMTWDQVKEVADSGLVTISSHADNLHKFVDANPQGNIEESPYTFIYDPKTKKYETDQQFRERIHDDLARSAEILTQRLGRKPHVLTWPFGAYNDIGVQEARQLGFDVCLTLDTGYANVKRLDRVNRYYVNYTLNWAQDFKEVLEAKLLDRTLVRGVQIDLDKIVDPGSYEISNQNLGKCLDRLKSLGVNTVFVQGYRDIEGTGTVKSVYFANTVLPVSMDFLSHAINRIRSRGIQAFVWMPVLAFQLPDRAKSNALGVKEARHGIIGPTTDSYKRLSPFDPRSLEISRKIFRDLAANVNMDGILFQDDAFLTDYEDFNPSAGAAFQKAYSAELTPAIVQNDELKPKWIQLKTDTLNNYINELIKTVHFYRPTAKIARNIYSEAVTNPASQEWFAQNFESYLQNYDYTMIMTYSKMEKIGGARKVHKWMDELMNQVNRYNGKEKVIFKVQAFDWARNQWIDGDTLRKEISYLLSIGARHVAYYPDGVIEDKPNRDDISSIISGQDFSQKTILK